MAKDSYLMIYFIDIFFDDSGNKTEKEIILNILESDITIDKIVKNGGVLIGDLWRPYHQIHKIIRSYKEVNN